MESVARWYERARKPYQVDKSVVHAYAEWLKAAQWQLFCTFTFAWRVSDPQASKTFDAYINKLERHYKADIGYVRGDEKRFSGCGKPACGRHYHALFASAAPLDPQLLEDFWMKMAGNRTEGKSAQVEPYCPKPNQDPVSYVLKLTTQPDGDWASRKLELFLPPQADSQSTTCRFRRKMRRHLERQKHLQT